MRRKGKTVAKSVEIFGWSKESEGDKEIGRSQYKLYRETATEGYSLQRKYNEKE